MGEEIDKFRRFLGGTIAEGFENREREIRDKEFVDGYRAAASHVMRPLRNRTDDLSERAKQGSGLKPVESAQLAALNEFRDDFVAASEKFFEGRDVRWCPLERVVKAPPVRRGVQPEEDDSVGR